MAWCSKWFIACIQHTYANMSIWMATIAFSIASKCMILCNVCRRILGFMMCLSSQHQYIFNDDTATTNAADVVQIFCHFTGKYWTLYVSRNFPGNHRILHIGKSINISWELNKLFFKITVLWTFSAGWLNYIKFMN